MNENFNAAAEVGDINLLYTSIREDPYQLDRIDHQPFVESPLHVAASLGHIQFAMEIMRLKPSLARKPNLNGLTPLHLALQNEQTKMVDRLVSVESDLVRVQGREGKTALHYAAEEGNVELLTRFLSVCPLSIQDVTIRNETALHIAVKNYKFEAFDCMVGRLRRFRHEGSDIQEKQTLNRTDDEGNSLLHIAALTNQPQVVKILLDCGVDVNVKNSHGLTALDISENPTQVDNREVKKLLNHAKASKSSSLRNSKDKKDYLRSKISFKELYVVFINRYYNGNITNETRNLLLVVAVLIATAAYQAALSPPGGVWQENISNDNSTFGKTLTSQASSQQRAGTVIMEGDVFAAFWFFNTFALLITTGTIYVLLPRGIFKYLLVTPLFLFLYCYLFAMGTISPPRSLLYRINMILCFLISIIPLLIFTSKPIKIVTRQGKYL